MSLRIKPVAIAGIIILCAVLAAGSFYIYLRSHARQIFNAQVSALTSRHVEARHIKAQFPSTLLISGLSVDGLMICPQVRVVVDLLSFLGPDVRIAVLELDDPAVTWEQPATTDSATGTPVAIPGDLSVKSSSRARSVMLSNLLIRNGIFTVKKADAQGVMQTYILDRVQLRMARFPLTDTAARTDFFLTASLMKLNVPFIGHFLKMDGWFNWHARDMEARAQVVDDDGRVGVDAKLSSRQNDLQVFGTLRLLADQGPQAVGKKMGLLEDVVLNTLTTTRTDIETNFSFKTKMDRPQLETVHLSGQITTGLNSYATSGNIVAGLEALGAELFKMPASSP